MTLTTHKVTPLGPTDWCCCRSDQTFSPRFGSRFFRSQSRVSSWRPNRWASCSWSTNMNCRTPRCLKARKIVLLVRLSKLVFCQERLTFVIRLARDESRFFGRRGLDSPQLHFVYLLPCLVVHCSNAEFDVMIVRFEIPSGKASIEQCNVIQSNCDVCLLEEDSTLVNIEVKLQLGAFLDDHRLIGRSVVVAVLDGVVKLFGNFSYGHEWDSALLQLKFAFLPPQMIFSRHFGFPSLSVISPP